MLRSNVNFMTDYTVVFQYKVVKFSKIFSRKNGVSTILMLIVSFSD